MWQSSTNGGTPPWTDISNTTNTYSPTPAQSTVYRAVVQSGVCPFVYSDTAVISIIVPLNPTITTVPSPPTICLGQSAILTASSGTFDGPFTNGGWFNSSMVGWRVDGSDNLNASPANNQEGPWGRAPNRRTYGGRPYKSDNGAFGVVNGLLATEVPPYVSVLETPEFSLIGMPSAYLNWNQAIYLTSGATARIELVLSNGTIILFREYIGSITVGNNNG